MRGDKQRENEKRAAERLAAKIAKEGGSNTEITHRKGSGHSDIFGVRFSYRGTSYSIIDISQWEVLKAQEPGK